MEQPQVVSGNTAQHESEQSGLVPMWNLEDAYRMQEAVNKKMETFYIEKQRKSAESAKHAATVILTA